MKRLCIIYFCLVRYALATDKTCSANDPTCSCQNQPYHYLAPIEETAFKALIFYNHVHKRQKRRDASSVKIPRSAKFYSRRQFSGESFSFDKSDPIDAIEMADMSGMSSVPLQQVTNALQEIQPASGISDVSATDPGNSLTNLFPPDQIKELNEMAATLEAARQRQGNRPQGAQNPQQSFVQDVNLFNGFCKVLTRCGTGIAQGIGWVGNGLDRAARGAGSAITERKTMTLIVIGFVGMTALIIGIAVGVYNNRGGSTTNGTHPAVLPPGESNGSTRGKLLFTHFRAELRGPAPKDMPQKKDPNVWAEGPVPDSAKKWLTDDEPVANQKDAREVVSHINQRDDKGDNFCLPTQAKDLNDVVYNIWQAVYKPRMANNGIMDQQYHIAHINSGAFDVNNGGSMLLRIWSTPDEPDLDDLKAPIMGSGPSLSTAPNWKDPQVETNHHEDDRQICYDQWLPSGADPSNPGPTISWWNAFSDACKTAFGSNRLAKPKDFTYSGAGGYSADALANGAGWLGEFIADPTCSRKLTCADLVGGSGDGKAGLARRHIDACRGMANDGRYHGGGAYMEMRYAVADSCGMGSPVNCGNGIAKAKCGLMRISPLTYLAGPKGFQG